MPNELAPVNVIVAGLGGQGVIKASDILADAAFRAGYDVKKSEVHGMSQRGGSVTSDVRFSKKVLSPMVPAGEADYLIVLDAGQVDNNRCHLRDGGVLITPGLLLGGVTSPKQLDRDPGTPLSSRNVNVAMLGALSTYVDIPEPCWHDAVRANLPDKVHAQNLEVFAIGRSWSSADGKRSG